MSTLAALLVGTFGLGSIVVVGAAGLFGVRLVMGAGLSVVENVAPDDAVMRQRLSTAVMVVPFVLVVAVLFAPLGYTVDAFGTVVNRLAPRVCILHSEIAEIRRLKRHEVGLAIRFCGSGGFFGSYGRYWSMRLGRYRAYTTNSKDLVLITRHDGMRFLLSPFPADAFIAAVENARDEPPEA